MFASFSHSLYKYIWVTRLSFTFTLNFINNIFSFQDQAASFLQASPFCIFCLCLSHTCLEHIIHF